MICKNCGKNNENSNKFCLNCGALLENNVGINNSVNLNNNSNDNNKIPTSNNRSIILIILMILIFILVLLEIGYINYKNTNSNTNNSDNNRVQTIEERIEELKNAGYEEVITNNININTELNNNEIIRSFDTTNGLEKLYEGTSKKYDNFTINLKDGIVVFNDNENQELKKEINVNNIRNVYITDLTCGGEVDLILLDVNGKIYVLNSLNTNSTLNELVLDGIQNITSTNTYIDILQWKQGIDTCSVEYKIVGIASDENMYFIDSNEIVDTKELYTTLNNINNSQDIKLYLNRDIEINGVIESYKLKMLVGNKYILTSDDYLYNIENNNLINDKKVQLILKNESNNLTKYVIIFNDNNSVEFSE